MSCMLPISVSNFSIVTYQCYQLLKYYKLVLLMVKVLHIIVTNFKVLHISATKFKSAIYKCYQF